MKFPRKGHKDVSIVLCGEAGQGLKTVEDLLVKVMKRSGHHVYSVKEYMSRIRGGSNSTSIRISPDEVRAQVRRMDIAVPLSGDALDHISWRVDEGTVVLFDPDIAGEPEKGNGGQMVNVEMMKKAKEIGGRIYLNIIAASLLSGLFGMDEKVFEDALKEKFSERSLDNNLEAMRKGFSIAEDIAEEVSVKMDGSDEVKDRLLMRGVDSISLGAVSGGCDLISSYPMSPSTGVLVALAGMQKAYGIVAEQAEDEISAINMALGAWYAGGRGMVTTSGGGYALMNEGLSLSGITELPVVIHLAQRPGPATGLPTRTEQGDLLFALFGGHGEFPRAIYAPGDPEEAFRLTAKAFDTADRFQIPVFVMSDQFFVDSYFNVKEEDLETDVPERHIVETNKDYRRYEYTDDGISPRGIPGHGKGVVNIDSDEHDEEGHITESMETRTKMVEKRLGKMKKLREEALEPTLVGDGEKDLVICWGSTFNTVKEAASSMDDVSVLHIAQIHPMNKKIGEFLENASSTICVENNATGQMAALLRMEFGLEVDEKVLKYDGLPFTVEELKDRLERIVKGGGR